MTWKETKNFNITKTTFEERMEEAGYRPDKEVIMTEEEIDVEIKAVEKRLKYLKQLQRNIQGEHSPGQQSQIERARRAMYEQRHGLISRHNLGD